MIKIKKVLLCISLLGALTLSAKEKKDIKIGITQIVEHQSLDSARAGFKRALKEKGYGDVKIEEQNAQGDMGTAQIIAKNFVNDKKDLILAISTPSAQAAYNATKDIPILITAVTDPKAAGLEGSNISGTSDELPIDQQIQLAKDVFPKIKKIGLIYNTSEQNSLVSIGMVKDECKKIGLEYEEAGVTTVNDIGAALDALLPKIDMIFLITDNLVISSAPLVIEKATKANKPVFAATDDQIPMGAVITKTLDYEKLGYRTGEMAVKILEGEKPANLPVEKAQGVQIMVNKKAAEKFGIDLKSEILKGALIVE